MKEESSRWKDYETNPYKAATEESQMVGTRVNEAMLFEGGVGYVLIFLLQKSRVQIMFCMGGMIYTGKNRKYLNRETHKHAHTTRAQTKMLK